MKETIANHRNTAKYLLVRTDYEEKRVQTQLAVVYQFMQQKDSKVNIQLAETSATIARESKKDSSAMKAIAVLTMCFLPGTFLAVSCFSLSYVCLVVGWENEVRGRR